jgi:hypothetical protein
MNIVGLLKPLAKLMITAAFALGLIGLIAGMSHETWRLTPIGWFTAGTLVAVLAIAVMVYERR